jgi:hypothetical protein
LLEGDEKVYEVERLEYKPNGEIDITLYQLKEVTGASFDSSGELNFRIERFIRPSEDAEWVIDAVWSARRNDFQAILVENNIPVIKLSFPMLEDKRWDGNAMNSLPEDEYKMKNFGASYMVSDFDFNNTVEVFKEDLLDPCKISADNYHIEVFAEGVGLIYKQDIDINYQSSSGCNPENSRIDFGLVVEQKLIDFSSIE